jgi:hypothetical protein
LGKLGGPALVWTLVDPPRGTFDPTEPEMPLLNEANLAAISALLRAMSSDDYRNSPSQVLGAGQHEVIKWSFPEITHSQYRRFRWKRLSRCLLVNYTIEIAFGW